MKPLQLLSSPLGISCPIFLYMLIVATTSWFIRSSPRSESRFSHIFITCKINETITIPLNRSILWDVFFGKAILKILGESQEKPPWKSSYSAEAASFASCQASFLTKLVPTDTSASMIFTWNMLNSDGARQLYLNGSECLTIKEWQYRPLLNHLRMGVKVLKFWMFLYLQNNLQYENTQT